MLARDGVVEVADGALAPLDLAIAKAWGRVKAAGYSPEAGFFAEDARDLRRGAGAAGPPRDRALLRPPRPDRAPSRTRRGSGQAGIELINELIALLRTRILLGLVAEIATRAPALDQPGVSGRLLSPNAKETRR